MAIVGIITIGTLISFLIYSIKDRWLTGVFLGLVVTCISFAISVLIIGCVSESIPENMLNVVKTEELKIIALKDNKGITSNSYLIKTHIQNDLYYQFAYQTEKGYKVKQVKADQCYIVYSEKEPKIEKYSAVSFENWTSWIYAFPLHEYYILYVPSETITSEFYIDLE